MMEQPTLSEPQQEKESNQINLKYKKGFASKVISVLLLLTFFAPWFTWEACNSEHTYAGTALITLYHVADITAVAEKLNALSNKESQNINKTSPFHIIGYCAMISMILVLLSLFFLFYNKKILYSQIFSILNIILIFIIILIIEERKEIISEEAKGIVQIYTNWGIWLSLFLSFLIIVIPFFEKFVLNINQKYEKPSKFSIGFLYTLTSCFMFLTFLQIPVFDNSISTDKKEISENNSLKDTDNKQKELELKEKELKLKEQELAKNRIQDPTSNNLPGLYPQTSMRKLDRMDVESMAPTKYDKKIMRNEIFARHGYIFKTDDMRNYFNNQSWYSPQYYDVNNMLSEIEKYNIELIKYAETGAE